MINPTLYIESLAAVVLPDDRTRKDSYLARVRAAYAGRYDEVTIGDGFIIGWDADARGFRRPIVETLDDERLAGINTGMTVVIPYGEYETLLAALRVWRRVVVMNVDGTWEMLERR